MRLSKSFIKTKKNTPKDEVAENAKLLIRAGYIHKEMAGVYVYLPLGKRVLENIAQVVREEMNAVGGEELQMSVLQPKELWETTDRWDDEKVDNWFKTKLKNGTELGVGLTHEEPIVDALSDYINSYKDLPVYVYQIQSKFRNEVRAKSGLMRGREFLMKDLYSLSRDEEEHERFYEKITTAYHSIYARLGIGDITYTTVADGGIFSKYSREFQTLSEVGEDTIYVHEKNEIAVNKEVLNDEVLADLGIERSELTEETAVEVGNIFPLGSKYSDALGVFYTDENDEKHSIVMGSYGIGISRLMGLLAEHFADEKGLVWPVDVAPFKVHLVSLPGGENQADQLYAQLEDSDIETIYDDRDMSAGMKLADADLMGMPLRIVCSKRTATEGKVEASLRPTGNAELIDTGDLSAIQKLLES